MKNYSRIHRKRIPLKFDLVHNEGRRFAHRSSMIHNLVRLPLEFEIGEKPLETFEQIKQRILFKAKYE